MQRKLMGAAVSFALIIVALLGTSAKADSWPTSGGDGGRIIEVTTLADSGPGSLRAAIYEVGRRKIVFRVAGEIWLKSTLTILQPFVTIAGEIAPSPGITLMGDRVRIRGHDVILRHIRVRVGARPSPTPPQIRDGISVSGAEDGSDPGYNVLVENCSISWSVDELVDIWGKNSHDIVIRRSILSEALRNSIHPKGAHSMGLMVGPDTHNVLIQANLFAHNDARNPVVIGKALVLNNLIYDPGTYGVQFYAYARSGPTRASVVGNVVMAGPSTTVGKLRAFGFGLNRGSAIYYRDNISRGVLAFDRTERISGPNGSLINPFVSTPPFWLSGISVLPSQNVPTFVLDKAGARPWARDIVDSRIIAEVKNRSGRIRDTPTDARLAPHMR